MANVTATRFETIKINGNVPLFFLNVTFNNPFYLKALNVANCYIFMCQRLAKVKNVFSINLVLFWCLLKKSVHFGQFVFKKFSFFGR